MHLGRRPAEPRRRELQAFYARLLAVLRRPEVHDGAWRLGPCRRAWSGNPTGHQFIVSLRGRRANAACWPSSTTALPRPSATSPFASRASPAATSRSPICSATEEHLRAGDDLASNGLYLDVPAWAPPGLRAAIIPLPPARCRGGTRALRSRRLHPAGAPG